MESRLGLWSFWPHRLCFFWSPKADLRWLPGSVLLPSMIPLRTRGRTSRVHQHSYFTSGTERKGNTRPQPGHLWLQWVAWVPTQYLTLGRNSAGVWVTWVCPCRNPGIKYLVSHFGLKVSAEYPQKNYKYIHFFLSNSSFSNLTNRCRYMHAKGWMYKLFLQHFLILKNKEQPK